MRIVSGTADHAATQLKAVRRLHIGLACDTAPDNREHPHDRGGSTPDNIGENHDKLSKDTGIQLSKSAVFDMASALGQMLGFFLTVTSPLANC